MGIRAAGTQQRTGTNSCQLAATVTLSSASNLSRYQNLSYVQVKAKYVTLGIKATRIRSSSFPNYVTAFSQSSLLLFPGVESPRKHAVTTSACTPLPDSLSRDVAPAACSQPQRGRSRHGSRQTPKSRLPLPRREPIVGGSPAHLCDYLVASGQHASPLLFLTQTPRD